MSLDTAFWVETERRKIMVRDDIRVRPEWLGNQDYFQFFKLCLHFSFYSSARFIADHLLEEGFPITSIRSSAYTYFEDLSRGKKEERLELALLFERDYLFHYWLEPDEKAEFDRLKLEEKP